MLQMAKEDEVSDHFATCANFIAGLTGFDVFRLLKELKKLMDMPPGVSILDLEAAEKVDGRGKAPKRDEDNLLPVRHAAEWEGEGTAQHIAVDLPILSRDAAAD